ncbi:MAG TPA: NADH-quinone oxidoreductase subunit C [Thermoanaerobaculia bacterium]|nr:NADH-quinone oxidoreductase subunit C [Thermoanaerobaculia bacterium]
MTDQPDTQKSGETPIPAGRGIEEILADPLLAGATAPLRDAVLEAAELFGELTLVVDRERIREVCESFKRDGYVYLVDLTAVDYSAYPGHAGDLRFAVVYHLYSFEKNARVRLKVRVAEGSSVPSVTSVWKTANWPERETWDMFGIEFEGHPNLERILMWDEFNGHPLRKDFPVRGIDTGARIYPEVFPAGGGPMAGSTGKNAADVNLYKEEWVAYGTAPVIQPAPPPRPAIAPPAEPSKPAKPAPEGAPAEPQSPAAAAPPAATVPATTSDAAASEAAPEAPAPAAQTTGASGDAPWHDETLILGERMELAKGRPLKDLLFAAMAQTDCGACGWDCEGYAEALASGETSDITLCVPGETETEDELQKLMTEAGKLRKDEG